MSFGAVLDSFYGARDKGLPQIEIINASEEVNTTSPLSLDWKDTSNTKVISEFLSESLSFILEVFVFTRVLMTQIMDFNSARHGMPLVIARITCAAIIFRYMSIRGGSYGEMLGDVFRGSKTFETFHRT